MLRRLRLPVVLILLAGILAAALLLVLPARDARAPEQTSSSSEEQAQDEAVAGRQAVAPTSVAAGFQDRLAADAPGATALAFLPDERLLVTDRTGQVLVRRPGETSTTVALDIRGSVCPNSERGLLGIAVDPDFGNNGYVYLYYTYKKYGVCPEGQPAQNNNPVNRVARFVMEGDTISPNPNPDPNPTDGPGEVLVDNIPSPNGNHNAGDLRFGKDGELYVSTGDGSCNYAQPTKCQPENDASRYRNVLLGKILRITPVPGNTIPADNPYAGASNGVPCGNLDNRNAAGGSAAAPDKVCQETYAMGFRNPFRFAMDPDSPQGVVSLRVNDVGGGRIEEISQVEKGKDYGWNCREGTLVLNTSSPCPAPEMVPPIAQYNHNTGCSSITGGAFVPNNAGWPSSYRDAYLYGDYVCGRIFSLQPNGGVGLFANGLQGGPVSFAFGPDGSLYYTTYSGGGQVRRVAFVDNKAPVADVKASPDPAASPEGRTDPETGNVYGPTPLKVDFDASNSTDDENDPVTFEWDFGDPDSANNTATGANPSHTYETVKAYTATLTASDDKGNSDTAKVIVYAGNTAPPQPVIESPASGATFEVGQQITLTGSATDADDGQDLDLRWEVIRHHTAPNTHTHPSILDPADSANGSVTFSAPGPEDLLSTNPDGNYLEVRLTATDSQGLSKTVSRALRPETTGVRFATAPRGFFVAVNGTKVRAPRTLLSWEGYGLNVYAPPQRHDGNRYVFRNWSDGKGARHTIVTPQDYTNYTARFKRK